MHSIPVRRRVRLLAAAAVTGTLVLGLAAPAMSTTGSSTPIPPPSTSATR
jgi:hypothetical protein